jgi:hypothetical protein
MQTLKRHTAWVTAVAFSPDDGTVRLWDPKTGAIIQTLDVNTVIWTLSFSVNGSYLETGEGLLDIIPSSLSPGAVLFRPAISRGIFVEKQWIVREKEYLLWLPSDYRPTSEAVRGNVVILGHASGRISFLEFNFL